MPTLITGTTGLLGNNLVRLLLDRGTAVRVLIREGCDPRPLDGLDVETVFGDVRDAECVYKACQGTDLVIHSAAVVRYGWTGLELLRSVNVEGTRHVATAARALGIRMMHVSSVDALAVGTRDQPADEDTPPAGKVDSSYVVTKREAEQVVVSLIEQGLDAVIVNPAFLIGPWDWKPSSGQMLLEVARRFTPIAPSGGQNVCDVRDVASGVIAAAAQGRTGRRYILGGENMTFFDIWRLFARVSGGGAPRMRAGPLMRMIGGAWGDLCTWITGKEGEFNSAAIKASSQFHYYSSRRAIEELDYRQRPIQQSVEDSWKWFQEYGYV